MTDDTICITGGSEYQPSGGENPAHGSGWDNNGQGDTSHNRPRVAIVAFEGVLGSSLLGVYDLLAGAGKVWSRFRYGTPGRAIFDVNIVAERAGQIGTDSGPILVANQSLYDITRPEIIIVPTSLAAQENGMFSRPSAWQLPVIRWIGDCYAGGSTICAVSTSALMLAQTGLLDGYEATTHWALIEQARHRYPNISFRIDRAVIPAGPDSRLLTAGGGTCWHEMTLYLIARHAGAIAAAQTARVFTISGKRGGQLPFVEWMPVMNHLDRPIRAGQDWIAQNFATGGTLAGALKASGLADRTFKRRFKQATGYAPTEYVQNVRIQEARFRLESGSESIESISIAVGYTDTAFFRSLFKKIAGLTPGEYRRQFSLYDDTLSGEVKTRDFAAA